jgi:adenosylcobinamide amidohydrolase
MLAVPAPVRAQGNALANIVTDAPKFTAARTGKYLVIELKSPHRVLSTSVGTGGQSDTIRYLVNHQSMEPAGDIERHDKIVGMSDQDYLAEIGKELQIDPMKTAMMGTAANINYLSHKRMEYRDLRVDVFVTAGVEGNATRAGDPAGWYEGDKGMERASTHGTINTILIVNTPLTPGAQARAIVTMTEGKSAALAELAVPSGVSAHLATGTGTDQFILAAPLDLNATALRNAGSHTKLGELIGEAVRAATVEALRWQNGLEASYTRNITRALGRFGLNERTLLSRLQLLLPAKSYDLLAQNRLSVLMEPRVAAAAYAYAAILDRVQYGTLPPALASEVLRDEAATVAVALSAKPDKWPEFWSEIPVNPADRLEPFVKGLALGWQMRWTQ